MSNRGYLISRRSFLRGAGAAIALPSLEIMFPPMRVFGQSSKPPLRLVNMVLGDGWGSYFSTEASYKNIAEFSPLLETRNGVSIRSHLNMIGGLQNVVARTQNDYRVYAEANGPIANDGHGVNNVTFFSGSVAKASGNQNWQIAKTYDQYIADLYPQMRFKSLGVNVQPGTQAVRDLYSQIHYDILFWRGPNQPTTMLNNPRKLFDDVFSNIAPASPNGAPSAGSSASIEAWTKKKSILDLVKDDLASLNSKLSSSDRKKMDEYLTSIRELETKIQGIEGTVEIPTANACSTPNRPSEPANYFVETYPARFEILQDLMVIALKCDLTRVFNFSVGTEGMEMGFVPNCKKSNWHDISHPGHENAPQSIIDLDNNSHKLITRWYSERFRELVIKMRNITESDGSSLLDNSLLVYSNTLHHGDSHNCHYRFVATAGKLGGKIKTGLDLDFPNGRVNYPNWGNCRRPMTDLWLTIMKSFGVNMSTFGGTDWLMNTGHRAIGRSTGVIQEMMA